MHPQQAALLHFLMQQRSIGVVRNARSSGAQCTVGLLATRLTSLVGVAIRWEVARARVCAQQR